MSLSYLFGDNAITIYVRGRSFTIGNDHRNYDKIKEAIKAKDEDQLIDLCEPARVINDFGQGRVSVQNGEVYYDGEVVSNGLTRRIIQMAEEGYDVQPLIKFMENLYENPSNRAIEELFKFMEHSGMPITEDGCFLAYKGVRSDYTDRQTGKIDNRVGVTVKMKRQDVDDDARRGCSHGLHAGTFGYALSYARNDGHFMLVKINPRDVVSVPFHDSDEKLRCCEYEVIAEYDQSQREIPEPVRAPDGTVVVAKRKPVTVPKFEIEDEEDEDEDEEEEEWEDEDEDEDEEDEDGDEF
jgi:hypothetical protein